MLILLGIGFVAGIVTALSPCVLPVLPIVLAGGATGPPAARDRRRHRRQLHRLHALRRLAARPARPAAGRAAQPRDRAALPRRADAARPAGRRALARPLQCLTRRRAGDLGGGFLLGASLGLVFVPCAGPVLAAVTVIAAKRDVGLDGVLLTLAYARRRGGADARDRASPASAPRTRFRSRAETVRRVAGVLVAVAALAIALRRRPGSPDRGPRLHAGGAGAVRALGGRPARARGADRRARARGRAAAAKATLDGLRAGTRVPGTRAPGSTPSR